MESHLLQMRGLKLKFKRFFGIKAGSHLLQMRGLKRLTDAQKTQVEQSHLLQMRGLKHFCLNREHHRHKVASFTDAWIETQRVLRSASTFKSHLLQMRGLKLLIIPKSINRLLVASFTDAWIETAMAQEFFRNAAVASFTDAWIETFLEVSALIFLVSHLLQMRGLKQQKE